MLTSKRWKTSTSLFVALGMTAATSLPLLTAIPAVAGSTSYRTAQIFRNGGDRVLLPAGTRIPVRSEDAERILVKPDETSKVTLIVAEDIVSRRGTVLIREGSKIEGELRPAEGGSQFVAETLIPEGTSRRYSINATSDVVTRTETIDRRSNPDILRGAAIGAAAAAVLSEIFGDIDLGEVLAGAGLGVLGEILLRRQREVEVVVINPDTDLDLTLEEDFYYQQQARRLGSAQTTNPAVL